MAGQSTPSYGMTSSHTNITEIVGTYLFSHVQLSTMTILFLSMHFQPEDFITCHDAAKVHFTPPFITFTAICFLTYT